MRRRSGPGPRLRSRWCRRSSAPRPSSAAALSFGIRAPTTPPARTPEDLPMADVDSDTALRQPPAPSDPPAVRDEEGDLNPGFVATLEEAIAADDRDRACALVEDLHESDLGDALEALAADDRTRLIALLGSKFDFTALTEVDDAVRDDILDDLKTEIVAEGVRELDADDAVRILEDLEPEEQAEILERLPAIERDALKRSLDYPEDSAGRRMQTS